MATTEVKTAYIGASVERKEDARLLRGETRWVDNMTLPGCSGWRSCAARTPHARIKNVDLSKALAADGAWRRSRAPNSPTNGRASLCLAGDRRLPHSPAPSADSDKARYAGDGVASSSPRAARSRRTPPSSSRSTTSRSRPSPTSGRQEGLAPLVHDEYDHNRAYTWPLQTGEIDRLFSEAPSPSRSTTASSG